MARQAVKSGTTEVVITHHVLDNQHYRLEAEILAKFEQMQARLHEEKIPLVLHLGAEIFYQPDMELSHRISTFDNNGRYFLVEFPMQGIPRGVDEKFFDLIMDGKTPVIAHPERNVGILRNPQRAYDFVQKGSLLQMNAGSLDGKYGDSVRELAVALMNSNLIHFIGSDGHNASRRPLKIGEMFAPIREVWGEQTAEMIFHDNPRKALAGEEIKPPEPMPVQPLRKPSRFNPLKLFKRLVGKNA